MWDVEELTFLIRTKVEHKNVSTFFKIWSYETFNDISGQTLHYEKFVSLIMLSCIQSFDDIRFKTKKRCMRKSEIFRNKSVLLWPSIAFEVKIHLIKYLCSIMAFI